MRSERSKDKANHDFKKKKSAKHRRSDQIYSNKITKEHQETQVTTNRQEERKNDV